MPIEKYQCEKCTTLYDRRIKAEKCEKEHPVMNTLKLVAVSADKSVIKSPFPDRLAVASSHSDEIAHYRLTHTWDESFEVALNP